jgi:hypothetical protein
MQDGGAPVFATVSKASEQVEQRTHAAHEKSQEQVRENSRTTLRSVADHPHGNHDQRDQQRSMKTATVAALASAA